MRRLAGKRRAAQGQGPGAGSERRAGASWHAACRMPHRWPLRLARRQAIGGARVGGNVCGTWRCLSSGRSAAELAASLRAQCLCAPQNAVTALMGPKRRAAGGCPPPCLSGRYRYTCLPRVQAGALEMALESCLAPSALPCARILVFLRSRHGLPRCSPTDSKPALLRLLQQPAHAVCACMAESLIAMCHGCLCCL